MATALVVAALAVAGCSGEGTGPEAATVGSAGSGAGLEGAITVSAAASLAEAFEEIGDRFVAANPGVEVALNVDASSILAAQVLEGAPVDVYASADEASMAELVDAGLVAGEPVALAGNRLVIVTRPGNPEGIEGLDDLADVGVVALCGEAVPCGRYARQVLDGAGVAIPEGRLTRGQNATATLAAVASGDAVAGIVYASDAVRAGDAVDSVAVPPEVDVVAVYPIGVLADTGDPAVAEAFVAHVLGPEGRAVLEEAGFLPPP